MNEANQASALQRRLQQVTDPTAAFALFDAQSVALFDHILFTALRFDHNDHRMTRLYSNLESVSPTGGTKPLPQGMWADRVIWTGAPYIGRSRLDLKDVFFDFEALWAAGCGSVMNIPVRLDGVTVGSFNILGREGQYSDEDPDRFREIAQVAGPLFVPTSTLQVS